MVLYIFEISQDFMDADLDKITTLFQETIIRSDIENNIRSNQQYTYLALPNDWKYSHWLNANYIKELYFLSVEIFITSLE